MTESLHAKPWWFTGRALPCNNSWHTKKIGFFFQESRKQRDGAPCQPEWEDAQDAVYGTISMQTDRQFCALSQAQMCKHNCTNIYIFKLNTAKLLSPPQDHMASFHSLTLQCQRSDLISPITRDPLLIHAVCCSLSMQQCASWRLHCAYCALVYPLLSHTAQELLIAPCSPVV